MKTLFNQNVVGSKNVSNSNSISKLDINKLVCANANITNLTNAELQNATANISANTTNISGKQDKFNVDGIVLTLNTGVTPNVLAVTTSNDVTQASNALVLGGGLYTYLLNNYNKKLTNGSPLQLQINSTGTGINVNDELRFILASSASSTDVYAPQLITQSGCSLSTIFSQDLILIFVPTTKCNGQRNFLIPLD